MVDQVWTIIRSRSGIWVESRSNLRPGVGGGFFILYTSYTVDYNLDVSPDGSQIRLRQHGTFVFFCTKNSQREFFCAKDSGLPEAKPACRSGMRTGTVRTA
jgi:hypothetical protein